VIDTQQGQTKQDQEKATGSKNRMNAVNTEPGRPKIDPSETGRSSGTPGHNNRKEKISR